MSRSLPDNTTSNRGQKTHRAYHYPTKYAAFKTPKTILFADKPPRLGGKVIALSTNEFEQKIQASIDVMSTAEQEEQPFRFSSEVLLSEDVAGYFNANYHEVFDEFLIKLPTNIENYLQSPPQSRLAICYINELVGYGVFNALTDEQTIKQGSVVTHYAGVLKHTDQEISDLRSQSYRSAIQCFAFGITEDAPPKRVL